VAPLDELRPADEPRQNCRFFSVDFRPTENKLNEGASFAWK